MARSPGISELEESFTRPKYHSLTVNAKARWNKNCYQFDSDGIHVENMSKL